MNECSDCCVSLAHQLGLIGLIALLVLLCKLILYVSMVEDHGVFEQKDLRHASLLLFIIYIFNAIFPLINKTIYHSIISSSQSKEGQVQPSFFQNHVHI